MTKSDLDRDSPVMMSSTMPSAKYSCSGSPLMFWNGSTAMEGLSGRGSGCAVSLGGLLPLPEKRLGNAHAPDPHRFGDILQRLRTHVLKSDIDLATNLPVSIVGNANAARFCDLFETHRNIDPVTKDIVLFDNNITDVNADAKFDPLVLRHIDILFGHAALNFVGAAYGIDDAGELNESAVPGILDDASVMISDFGIKKRLSQSFQLRQRAFFVDPYQAARARDIRRQNSCQSPLYVLAAQDAPPRLGEIECSYSTIVGRCPAMPMSEMGADIVRPPRHARFCLVDPSSAFRFRHRIDPYPVWGG